MCFLAVVVGRHPDLCLVVAHNREEMKDRGAETGPWQVDPKTNVYSMPDLRAGGTFMGLNSDTGAFCTITNVRCPAPLTTPTCSRGLLVRRCLEGVSMPQMLAEGVYDGCHLVYGNVLQEASLLHTPLHHTMNTPTTTPPSTPPTSTPTGRCCLHTEALAQGALTCLSNDHVLQSDWPKVCWARSRLEATLPLIAGVGKEAVMEAFALIVEIMSTSNTLDTSAMDLSFTCYDPWQERHLQQGPFIRPNPAWPEHGGTMMQSVVIASKKCRQTFYFSRRCDGDPKAGEWTTCAFDWKD
eukprot:NODE_3168_length_1017_cov_50.969663_g3024_i0.p1 GENE.NODE_3168_length_1017_cov_50.969663_g3024_i0~~NODE_3168_length_1017_cov_50.969663_g3024_i0.p1  ORF type:complete len:297 (+),score=57.50 NODE_3168_length_1017_cov_50.969663_g3024_i0:68-958(+)